MTVGDGVGDPGIDGLLGSYGPQQKREAARSVAVAGRRSRRPKVHAGLDPSRIAAERLQTRIAALAAGKVELVSSEASGRSGIALDSERPLEAPIRPLRSKSVGVGTGARDGTLVQRCRGGSQWADGPAR